MIEEEPNLQQEHDKEHKDTIEVLKETDQALEVAQKVISDARTKLKKATEKYEERLYGPTSTNRN